MTDEKRPDPPDPLEDVRKGLGLLFRAAQGAVASLPTERLEKVISTGAEEVKRAFVNVSQAIEREVRGDKSPAAAPPAAGDKSASTEAPGEAPVRIAPDDQPPQQ